MTEKRGVNTMNATAFPMRMRAAVAFAIAICSILIVAAALPAQGDDCAAGTFSIVARDPATGDLGMAVESKAFAAGSRTITVKGGLAAIAHQASSNPMYGTIGLELLGTGMTPQQALEVMLRSDEGREIRQVAIIDAQGRTAAWTGSGADGWKGHNCGVNYCVQGNILTGPEVVDAMARSFESSAGPLAERMLAALDAGQAAGGDARGAQAAALVVARPLAGAGGFSDRVVDLRVDDNRTPLAELRRLLNMQRSGGLVTDAINKMASGDLSAAEKAARAACEKSPENDVAWVVLGSLHLRLGRKAAAIDALRKAVELNPAGRLMIRRNPDFEALYADPGFQRITEPSK